jgi:hypothetical protein
MTADIVMKQGDLEPPISVSLTDSTGSVVSVVTAESVKFRMSPTSTLVELFSRAATIEDAASGLFSYRWQVGDTDVSGAYYGEFVVSWPAGRTQTFPTSGYITIAIEPRL